MKNCNIKIFTIVVLIVLAITICAITLTSAQINGNYTLRRVFYNVFEYYNQEQAVSILTESYGCSKKEAEKIYKNKNNYVRIIIKFEINNDSSMPLFFSKMKINNNSEMFTELDAPESQSLCYIEPGGKTSFSISVILNKTYLNHRTFSELEFKPVFWKLFSLGKIDFYGYQNEIDDITDDLDFSNYNDFFNNNLPYFIPIKNTNTSLCLDDFNDVGCHIARLNTNRVYTMWNIEGMGKRYYGLTFFDDNGQLTSGMLTTRFLNKESDYESLTSKCSSLRDVKKIDNDCIVFNVEGKSKTYHYFNDATCLEITYGDDNLITSVLKINVEYMFDSLTENDMDLIMTGEGLS